MKNNDVDHGQESLARKIKPLGFPIRISARNPLCKKNNNKKKEKKRKLCSQNTVRLVSIKAQNIKEHLPLLHRVIIIFPLFGRGICGRRRMLIGRGKLHLWQTDVLRLVDSEYLVWLLIQWRWSLNLSYTLTSETSLTYFSFVWFFPSLHMNSNFILPIRCGMEAEHCLILGGKKSENQ